VLFSSPRTVTALCSITEWTVTTGETIIADFSSASPAPECEEIAPFDDTDSPTPSPSGAAAILTSISKLFPVRSSGNMQRQ
jgi:hypothetical protein